MTDYAPERLYFGWKAVPGNRPGKTDKLPVDPRSGTVIDPHNPAHWLSREEASSPTYGLAMETSEAAALLFLDLDHAYADGAWSPLAVDLVNRLNGCYVEVSYSGTGLHVIGRGRIPPHSTKNTPLGLELYSRLRFCALTGTHARGSMNFDATIAFTAIAAEFFPPRAEAVGAIPAEWTEAPCEGYGGPTDDDELIAVASKSRSARAAFGGKATFKDLWDGNAEALSRTYPTTNPGEPYGASEADAALASHLAFWTGKDCERIRRLMERSALRRDKWDRETYIVPTILGAVAKCREVATAKKPRAAAQSTEGDSGPGPGPGDAPAAGILLACDLAAHFHGCVYIEDRNAVATPDGALLDSARFNTSSRYGGRRFAWIEGKPKEDAWKAFVQNEQYTPPFAHALCFRPELPPGALLPVEGRILFNTYVPVPVRKVEGDPAPLLRHLQILFPVERDRLWVIYFLARMVQSPGWKGTWCLLVQGCEGNGKSLLLDVAQYCVGERYSHLPKASGLGNKFNSWVDRKLFLGVEEVYVNDRWDLLDALKVLVTSRRIEVEAKGVDQVMADNRTNMVLLTNHRDAIPKTANDRRFATFFCPQQCVEDLARDGLTDGYFARIWKWLREEDGFAIAAHWLSTLEIPAEMDPALTPRAPFTSTTAEAIAASRTPVEQAILEAVENEDVGFRGGWVSSTYLRALLETRRLGGRVHFNAWDALMKGLGYIKHPALPNGRANTEVEPEMKKSRLWVRADHLTVLNTVTAAEAARLYSNANRLSGSALAVAAQ